MSMHMDAEFKKEQNGTLFCLVGALHWKGGFGGGKSHRGVHPKKYACLSETKHPPGGDILYVRYANYLGTSQLVGVAII